MAKDRMNENRRGWVRNQYRGTWVSWRLTGAGQWRSGRLIDVSTSGAGLCATGELPRVGREIQICFQRGKWPLPYRVVRSESRQGVLGCRITAVQNRRDELRDCFAEAPVLWRNTGKGRWRRGRLINASRSGLGLLVHAVPPRAGEKIELALEGTGQRERCRVLRTAVREANQIMVACRMVSPGQWQAWLPPSLNAQTDPHRLIDKTYAKCIA